MNTTTGGKILFREQLIAYHSVKMKGLLKIFQYPSSFSRNIIFQSVTMKTWAYTVTQWSGAARLGAKLIGFAYSWINSDNCLG